MKELSLQIEVLDFYLERIGFNLSVLHNGSSSTNSERTSNTYMRMTLLEMNAFIAALKAAKNTIRLVDSEMKEPANDRGAGPLLVPADDVTEAEMASKLAFTGRR